MSKHTVMAWNERHILVEHVLVDRATDDCDPVMSAVHRLQRALGAKDDDPRWQAWHGHAEVAVTSTGTTEQNVAELMERLNRVPAMEAERDAARAELEEVYAYIESKHNGYGETGRDLEWPVPSSHLQALRELVEEREGMRDALREKPAAEPKPEPKSDWRERFDVAHVGMAFDNVSPVARALLALRDGLDEALRLRGAT